MRTFAPHVIAIVSTAALATALLAANPAQAGGPTDPVGGEVKLGAAGGLTYLSEALEVGSSGHFGGSDEAAWVACGPHDTTRHTVSGGGKVSGTSQQNMLVSMRPMDLDAPFESPDDLIPDDWWDTTVHSVLGRTMTGYEICTKNVLRYVRTTTPDDTTTARVGTTTCPANLTMVGGGAFIATSDSFINGSYPGPNNTWIGRVHDAVGGAGGMETYAVCRHNSDVVKRVKSLPALAVGASGFAIASCPADRHVIGGGGWITGSIDDAHLAASFPVDGPDHDTVPDDGWRVVGYNDAGTAKTLKAVALCVKKG